MTLCWYDGLCLQCWPVSADWPCVDMTGCVYSADQCLLTDPVLIWRAVFTVLTSVCWLTLCWYGRLCLQCWPVSANWPCIDMTDWPLSANWPCINMTNCVYSADQCLLTDPALIWQTDQCLLTDPTLIWQTVLQCWPVSASWPCVDMTDCVTMLTSVC